MEVERREYLLSKNLLVQCSACYRKK